MGDQSTIEWTQATWNPTVGCSRVSEGCRHCYAERQAFRAAAMGISRYDGITKKIGGEIRWTGEVRLVESALALPLRWKRPRRIFVNSMSDLFHEAVPDGWVMRILNVMARTPHVYQILTKRPERMRDFFTRWADLSGEDFNPKLVRGPEETRKAHPSGRGQLFAAMLDAMGRPPKGAAYPTFDWMEGMIRWPAWLPNVWLGVSVEDQATADARIPRLLQTPAAVRWVSYEPALGPVDFSKWLVCEYGGTKMCGGPYLDWIVVGGESGHGARPFDLAWARQTITQARAAGVPVFMKQAGSCFVTSYYDDDYRMLYEDEGIDWPEPIDWDIHYGQPPLSSRVRIKLDDRKGGNPIEWPEDLRVREYPEKG